MKQYPFPCPVTQGEHLIHVFQDDVYGPDPIAMCVECNNIFPIDPKDQEQYDVEQFWALSIALEKKRAFDSLKNKEFIK
jgi:hypothetical protein